MAMFEWHQKQFGESVCWKERDELSRQHVGTYMETGHGNRHVFQRVQQMIADNAIDSAIIALSRSIAFA